MKSTTSRDPQPWQPLLFAPLELLRCGLAAAHNYPLVGRRDTETGKVCWSDRRPAEAAWRFSVLEWGRTPISTVAVVLDCDSREAVERAHACAMGAGPLPSPSLTITRRASGHLHAAWLLTTPVHRYEGAREKPLRALARISEFYSSTVGADPGFNEVLVNNPIRADEYETAWLRVGLGAYGLGDLLKAVPKGWRLPQEPTTAAGRHMTLFRLAMRRAGYLGRSDAEVERLVWLRNAEFDPPLPWVEVRGLVKDVLGYRQKWRTRVGGNQEAFIKRQSSRGRRSGAKRRESSAAVLKPWEAAGVSRRTWYRDRARTEPKGSHGGARRRSVSSGTRTNVDSTAGGGRGS